MLESKIILRTSALAVMNNNIKTPPTVEHNKAVNGKRVYYLHCKVCVQCTRYKDIRVICYDSIVW